MSQVAMSFASLVKSNNGFFKSEKQAAFLLSQCQEQNVFYAGGSIYKNSYMMEYHCDAKGVVKVVKYLSKTARQVVMFERMTGEAFIAKQEATQAAKKREIEREAVAMAKYQARLDAFQVAFEVAKAYIKQTLVNSGSSEDAANRCVGMILKDSDDIQDMIEDLIKCPEFVKAWEIYNNTPGR